MKSTSNALGKAGARLPRHSPVRELLPALSPWKIAAAAAAVVVLGAAAWSRALHFGFIYDDHLQIESNPGLRSWPGLIGSLHEPLWSQLGADRASPYYRPLFSLLLFLQYSAFGSDARLWHLAAIGMHIFVALALFGFLLLHFGRLLAASAGACIFVSSPVTAEVVNWVSATDDSMCAFFFLLAICGLALARRASAPGSVFRLRVLSGWSLSLAIFAKETAVVALPLALAYECFVRRERLSRRDLLAYGPVFLSLMVLLIVHPFPHLSAAHATARILATSPFVATFALRKLIWPLPVSEFYDLWIDQPHSPIAIALRIVALAMIGCACLWLARSSRFAAWTLLAIGLPIVVSIAGIAFFRDYDLFHDRYLYWPFAGCAMLFAAAMAKAGSNPRMVNLAVALLTVALCVQTWLCRSVASQFSGDLPFYTHAAEVAPHNIAAIQLLAEAELRIHDCSAALDRFQQAQQLRPDLWQTSFYLGVGNLRCGGSIARAADLFSQSAALSAATTGQAALSLYELGRIRLTLGDIDGARAALEQAALRDPGSVRIRALLADIRSRPRSR